MNGNLKEDGKHYIHFTSPPQLDNFHYIDGEFYICEDEICGICDIAKSAWGGENKDLYHELSPHLRLYGHGFIDEDEVSIFMSWGRLRKEFAKMVSGKNIHLQVFDLVIKTSHEDTDKMRFPKYELVKLHKRKGDYEKENDIYFPLANESLTDNVIAIFTRKLLV